MIDTDPIEWFLVQVGVFFARWLHESLDIPVETASMIVAVAGFFIIGGFIYWCIESLIADGVRKGIRQAKREGLIP